MNLERGLVLSVLALVSAPAPRSARRYTSLLMRRNSFGHQTRIPANRKRFDLLGENLALSIGADPGANAVVRSWLRSPSHRRVVLARGMQRIGAAKTRGSFRGRPATIRVLHLGRLR